MEQPSRMLPTNPPKYPAPRYVTAADERTQWYSAKTTGDKLDLVFLNIADDGGTVETVIHLGARDFVVCYSKPAQS